MGMLHKNMQDIKCIRTYVLDKNCSCKVKKTNSSYQCSRLELEWLGKDQFSQMEESADSAIPWHLQLPVLV